MRKKDQKQMPLMDRSIDHPHAYKLRDISRILAENPIIEEMVLRDLNRGVELRETGAEGISAEQVARAAIATPTGSGSRGSKDGLFREMNR